MTLSRPLPYVFMAVSISAIAVACGSGSSGDGADAAVTCPGVSACPDSGAIPSYKTDIEPILQQTCTSCHSPKGIASNQNLTSYAGVYSEKGPVLDQVHDCMMPPQNAPDLTAAQRVALTTWLYCGSPDN
jgi:hypothetical protein